MALSDLLFWRSERRNLNNPATQLSAPAEWLFDALGSGRSTTGVSVTPENSLELSSVWATVKLVAGTVATLPLPVFREDETGKHRAKDHPVYHLLQHRPNPEMSAFIFRELQVAHLLLFGGAYAEIERNGRGDCVALWPLVPSQVRTARVGDQRVYLVRVAGGNEVPIAPENMLHVQGFGLDGQAGLIPTFVQRDTIGQAKAVEKFSAAFFANGAVPLTALTVPGTLTADQKKEIREGFEKQHQGLSRAQRVAILSGGMSLTALGISPEQSQLLESKRFSVQEVARVFGVPAHLIGDLEHATFSNIEQQSLDFSKFCIEPLTRRIEGELRKLFTDGHYAEHVLEGLLRGDSAARAAFYREMTNIGAMTINEVRRREGLNDIEGGDVPRVPLNTAPLGAEQEAA